MIQIILFTHGPLSVALKESLTMFFGDEAQDITTFTLYPQDSVEEIKNNFKQTVLSFTTSDEKGNVLVFVDILSGTPFNIVAQLYDELSKKVNLSCFTGVNLPILMEAMSNRSSLDINQMNVQLTALSKESITNLDSFLLS